MLTPSFDLNGMNPLAWGTKGVQETTAAFNWAQGVGVDPVSGNVWVANTRNNRIDEFTTDGTGPARILGQRGAAPRRLDRQRATTPAGLATFVG